MQAVSDSTILGDFSGSRYAADGVNSVFFKKGSDYILNTEGSDGRYHDYKVRYVFGYFPLQQYLIETQGGRLQSSRQSWNSRNKKWFHQYPGEHIHFRDWLHWTGNSQNWNTMCASCHSTNFKKNYNFERDSYSSSFSEMNVACETCHGPGSKHLAYVQSESYANGGRVKHAWLEYGKEPNNQDQLRSCVPCHTRKTDLAAEYHSSSEVLDNWIPELISSENYFADGQIMGEDYEYGSFVQSKMYKHGVKCSDCHNPHSGKIRKTGNTLCLSCHQPKYGTEAHHFHKISGEGSQCVNCHMPQKTYMGNDHRRDHSFRIPRPDQSLVYKTPNACNTCHSNRTTAWAASAIQNRYGNNRAYHFSDDLLPASASGPETRAHALKLAADTSQPEIARATAVFYLGKFSDLQTCEALLKYSKDEQAMLRYQAFRALQNFPAENWLADASHGLTDKVKAVRIAAADLYHLAGELRLPSNAKKAYNLANAENKAYLHYQRDFAVGNVMVADYYLQESDYKNAIVHYLRGLQKDSLMNYPRLNLASAYNGVGLNQNALAVLNQAAQLDPENESMLYKLALIRYEMGDPTGSDSCFKKALATGKASAEVYYNYGLLLQQNNNNQQAESILLKGHAIFPVSSKLLFALSSFYLQKGQTAKALHYGRALYQSEPMNQSYQELYQYLHLN